MALHTPLAVLFADVSGSTKLFERAGDLEARRLIAYLLDALGQVCSRHDGRMVKTVGDEILCVFACAIAAADAAVAMQRFTAVDDRARAQGLGLRIGLHLGDCLVEADGDVFGDAVNTAARMVALAARDQVIVSKLTADALPGRPLRDLGEAHVAGKQAAIAIAEILWQDDAAGMTMVQGARTLPDAAPLDCTLRLEHRGCVIALRPDSAALTLGRDPSSGLVVDAACVSRGHAHIDWQRGHYVLSDRSTNGTWVQTEGDGPQRLHRDALRLRRSGVIRLGKAIESGTDDLLYFRCPPEAI